MKRFELGMSINYASNWGVVDAVREFFQNALDEEIENSENKMFIKHEGNVLSIGNKKSKLKPSSLLLGASSKKDKEYLIGEHGEGYKVATVVLMRNGITVRIYNNENKEVWTSKVVNSRRYDSEIVVFDIEKKLFNKDCDLVIELDGITEDMYSEVVESNLHLRDDVLKYKESKDGRVLLDSQFKGNVYVNGLYVCNKDSLDWGYDFKPGILKLDRDRGLIDTFDLKFAIAGMISKIKDVDFIANNIKSNDFQFIASRMRIFSESDMSDKLSDKVYSDFTEEYGYDAIPVKTSSEFNSYKSLGYDNIVMVEDQVYETINNKKRNYTPEINDIEREFLDWYEKAVDFLPTSLSDEILNIWRKKDKVNE